MYIHKIDLLRFINICIHFSTFNPVKVSSRSKKSETNISKDNLVRIKYM